MGNWIFVRLGMVLIIILAFALFTALYEFEKKVIRKVKVKESER